MSDNPRRDAIKAALTAVAFVPIAAAVGSQDGPPSGQSPKQDSAGNSSANGHRAKKPDAKVALNGGRGSRMKFKESKSPSPSWPITVLSAEDAKAFQTELDQLKTSLASLDSSIAHLPNQRVESVFTYAAEAEVFSMIRCDSLALEASALVAKCKDLRREWESLYETSFTFLSDIDRFYRLDAIFQVEEANGVYLLDSSASQADLQSATSAAYPLTNAALSIKAIYDDLNATFNDQYGWIQLLGWLSHISGYGQSGYATATVGWNGGSGTVINYCYDAAVAQGQTQLQSQSNQLYSAYQSIQAQVDALNARFPGLQTRASWDLKNQQYRQLRVQAMRDLYAQRRQLTIQPSGPLNFTERLANLQQVFDLTFSDALARFMAIFEGFSTLFGFNMPIPNEVLWAIQHPGQPQPSTNVLDLASNWLDAIGRWYTRFLQHEQTYSLCLPVKDAVGREAWHHFLSTGLLSLTLPEELFPQQYFVRCRAVGMYTVGLHGFCSGRLRLPRDSYYIHKDLTKHEIDQSAVPLQRLSQIMPTDGNKPTERVGMNTLFNCSPFGQWEISLSERTSSGEKREHLENLLLEIIVVEQ